MKKLTFTFIILLTVGFAAHTSPAYAQGAVPDPLGQEERAVLKQTLDILQVLLNRIGTLVRANVFTPEARGATHAVLGGIKSQLLTIDATIETRVLAAKGAEPMAASPPVAASSPVPAPPPVAASPPVPILPEKQPAQESAGVAASELLPEEALLTSETQAAAAGTVSDRRQTIVGIVVLVAVVLGAIWFSTSEWRKKLMTLKPQTAQVSLERAGPPKTAPPPMIVTPSPLETWSSDQDRPFL